jgi:hypothetical protein
VIGSCLGQGERERGFSRSGSTKERDGGMADADSAAMQPRDSPPIDAKQHYTRDQVRARCIKITSGGWLENDRTPVG